jgi:hypothetical protein
MPPNASPKTHTRALRHSQFLNKLDRVRAQRKPLAAARRSARPAPACKFQSQLPANAPNPGSAGFQTCWLAPLGKRRGELLERSLSKARRASEPARASQPPISHRPGVGSVERSAGWKPAIPQTQKSATRSGYDPSAARARAELRDSGPDFPRRIQIPIGDPLWRLSALTWNAREGGEGCEGIQIRFRQLAG